MPHNPSNLFHKLILTYIVFIIQLMLQITCKNITISTQNITIPHNTFKFNSKSATNIYLCISQIQGDTVIILYLMRYGKNLYDVNYRFTQIVSNNYATNKCDSTKDYLNPPKNTDYNLVMVIHTQGLSNICNYKVQIGSKVADSPFIQTFSGTFSTNNIYYTKNISYQPCISYYQLTFTPPAGTPSLNLLIRRTIAGSTTKLSYIIETSPLSVTISNVTTDQIWSYQFIYNKSSYSEIYSYTVLTKGVLFADDKLSTECCRKYFTQSNCNSQPPKLNNPIEVGAIIGGVVGGLLFLIIAILIAYRLCKRKAKQIPQDSAESQKDVIVQNKLALKKVDSSEQIINKIDSQQYLPRKCAVCDGDKFCNVKCGFCGLKFHDECIENWIKNNRKCPRKSCQKSNFKKVIAQI